METLSRKFVVEQLSATYLEWFVNTAAVNMLTDELKRPELVHYETIYGLAIRGMMEDTAFIVRCDGEPVGALGSILTPNIYNPTYKVLAEMFWYVLPEYRNTRAGLMLLNAFDQKASEIADESTLSLLSSSKVNTASMEKRGFKMVELGFNKKYKE
jgi:hypothetical protein